MERYWNYAGDYAAGTPNPAPGCTITVYDASTLNLSTIYSDNSITPKANPFFADSDGFFLFYAANGRYDVGINGTGITIPFTWSDVLLADAQYAALTNTANTFVGNQTITGNLAVSGTLTVGGTLLVTGGKIPALSSTYFASLSGANLTALNAGNLGSGTVPSARLTGTYAAILALTNAGNTYEGTKLSLGATPATSGAINLTYNEFIYSKNVGGVDSWLLGFGPSGRLEINDVTTKDVIPLTDAAYDLGDPTHGYQLNYLHRIYTDFISFSGSGPAATKGAIRLAGGNPGLGNFGLVFAPAGAIPEPSIYLDFADRFHITGALVVFNGGLTVEYLQALQLNDTSSTPFNVLAVNASDQIVFGDGTADTKFAKALVALGGGAAPTVGTIGGSGPAAAGQYKWMPWIDSAGDAVFIPVWK